MEKSNRYRVNPTCPFCKEEHECWDITLSDEEQKLLDSYYESTKGRRAQYSGLANMLKDIEEKPLIVTRTLRCGICHNSFTANVAVFKEDTLSKFSPVNPKYHQTN